MQTRSQDGLPESKISSPVFRMRTILYFLCGSGSEKNRHADPDRAKKNADPDPKYPHLPPAIPVALLDIGGVFDRLHAVAVELRLPQPARLLVLGPVAHRPRHKGL